MTPRTAEASREYDIRQLHAMAPGRMGQTIGRAGGSRKDTTRGLLVASGLSRGVLPLATACCRTPRPRSSRARSE
jgi:hypothetical protein